VLPVVVGSPVSFPNKDDILHHVYSFSDATFTTSCAATSWPWRVPTSLSPEKDGIAHLTDLPPGEYSLTVWHPREKGSGSAPRHLGVEGPFDLDFELHLKPALKIRRAPGGRGKRY